MRKQLEVDQVDATIGDKLTSGISARAYPPYPRTKLAFYNIIQETINKANAAGYEQGYKNGREYNLETRANRYAEAICKLVDKL